MAFKKLLSDKNYELQSDTPLVKGVCGGCGDKATVDEYTCGDCAKGYPEPTEQERLDALEYARNWLWF